MICLLTQRWPYLFQYVFLWFPIWIFQCHKWASNPWFRPQLIAPQIADPLVAGVQVADVKDGSKFADVQVADPQDTDAQSRNQSIYFARRCLIVFALFCLNKRLIIVALFWPPEPLGLYCFGTELNTIPKTRCNKSRGISTISHNHEAILMCSNQRICESWIICIQMVLNYLNKADFL